MSDPSSERADFKVSKCNKCAIFFPQQIFAPQRFTLTPTTHANVILAEHTRRQSSPHTNGLSTRRDSGTREP